MPYRFSLTSEFRQLEFTEKKIIFAELSLQNLPSHKELFPITLLLICYYLL